LIIARSAFGGTISYREEAEERGSVERFTVRRQRRCGAMITAKRRVLGHYEVRKIPFANDYVWVPKVEEVEEWASKQRAHTEEVYRIELEAL
jgi:hypothetical protein